MLEGPKYYEFLYVDKYKNIWFVADRNLKVLAYSEGKYQEYIHNWGLSNELIDSYENINMIDPETASAVVTLRLLLVYCLSQGSSGERVIPHFFINYYCRSKVLFL